MCHPLRFNITLLCNEVHLFLMYIFEKRICILKNVLFIRCDCDFPPCGKACTTIAVFWSQLLSEPNWHETQPDIQTIDCSCIIFWGELFLTTMFLSTLMNLLILYSSTLFFFILVVSLITKDDEIYAQVVNIFRLCAKWVCSSISGQFWSQHYDKEEIFFWATSSISESHSVSVSEVILIKGISNLQFPETGMEFIWTCMWGFQVKMYACCHACNLRDNICKPIFRERHLQFQLVNRSYTSTRWITPEKKQPKFFNELSLFNVLFFFVERSFTSAVI